ncbi:hypothetical protein FRC03_006321 [Tulasnella sp. 419]|nr:hypothetical protein FRC03_006321 [Tulasnella sp. 419]
MRRFVSLDTRRIRKTHRSWESEERSEEEDDVLIGRRNTTTGTPVRRDESLVASLKYVNGVWDRGELPNGLNNASATKVQPRRRFTDEDEVDPGEETQDEVVYKGSSGSGLGGGSLMNVFRAGMGSMNGIGVVGMARKAPNSGVASGLTGTGSSTSVSVNSALGR